MSPPVRGRNSFVFARFGVLWLCIGCWAHQWDNNRLSLSFGLNSETGLVTCDSVAIGLCIAA